MGRSARAMRDASVRKKGSPKAPPIRARSRVERGITPPPVPRGARLILPAFRQRVQTLTFSILPSTRVRTTCRFGFHVRRVLLLACETLLPNATPLSQE